MAHIGQKLALWLCWRLRPLLLPPEVLASVRFRSVVSMWMPTMRDGDAGETAKDSYLVTGSTDRSRPDVEGGAHTQIVACPPLKAGLQRDSSVRCRSSS